MLGSYNAPDMGPTLRWASYRNRPVPPSKKDIEGIHLERFQAAFDEFPQGRIEPTEEPDFLIHRPNSVLGIELTELHRATRPGTRPQQASEAMRSRVVARAQELWDQRELPSVKVSVFMNTNYEIQKSEVEKLALAILVLAIKNLPEPNSSKSEEYDWINREYFPEQLLKVSVRRLDAITRTHFSSPGATWVATLADSDIKRALASKEPKYETYKMKCDEAWLVISADIGPMSTWFEYDVQKLSSSFNTQFDRLFLLRHFGCKLVELKTERT